MAFQIAYTVVQVVLLKEDLAMGHVLIVFFLALDGVLAASMGQNVLSKELQELGKFDSRARQTLWLPELPTSPLIFQPHFSNK